MILSSVASIAGCASPNPPVTEAKPALGGLWNPGGPRESATTHIVSPTAILNGRPLPLPAAVDNSAGLPPVGNQQSQGSCTAWAIGYYHSTFIENRESPINLTDPKNQTSPAFLYNIANGGLNGGSYMEDVADLLIANGAPSMAEMPYDTSDWTSWPDQDWIWVSGMKRKAVSQNWLPVYTADGMDALKAHLAAGNTATIGISVWGNFDNIESFNNTYCSSERFGSDRGGHIVTICGYDDNMTTADGIGAFKMVNSWGTGWGDAGFWWMTPEAMVDGFLGYGWVMYLESELNYTPRMVAKMQISHGERGDIVRNNGLNLTLSEGGLPLWAKTFLSCFWIEDWYGVNTQQSPFPEGRMSFDISDAIDAMDPAAEHQFTLSLTNLDYLNGTLLSLEIINAEWWEGGITWDAPLNIDPFTTTATEAWIYPGIFIHRPIRINNDNELETCAIGEFWHGNGSSADPYVIPGYYIWGENLGNCIFIGNTTADFIVRDCWVDEASTIDWSDFYSGSGISLYSVSGGKVAQNTVTANYIGIYSAYSEGTLIEENEISANEYGILESLCSDILICGNNASDNTIYGILVETSNTSTVFNNNLLSNAIQAYDDTGLNAWDDGYPSGGNYWSDYTGLDEFSGPAQNLPGSDEIGDTPYSDIDGGMSVQDNYPLMAPWSAIILSAPVRNLNTGENFTTIQGAIDDTDTLNGHVIEAANGTYAENVNVIKSVVIRGLGETIIDAGNNGPGLTLIADGATISRIQVINSAANSSSAGIKVMASNCTVMDSEIFDNSIGVDIGAFTGTTANSIDTTQEFDSGLKGSTLDSYEVETSTDNPAVQTGGLKLASVYGDAFSKPDSDGINWKWENGNDKSYGNGVRAVQTKNFDVTRPDAGYMALESVTQNDDIGLMGPKQIDCSQSWSLQIDFNRLYVESNNQWMFGFLLVRDWNGTGMPVGDYMRLVHYGFSSGIRYFADLTGDGSYLGSNYVSTTDTAGKLRIEYNSTSHVLRFLYWQSSAWNQLWSVTYNLNAWHLKILIPLISYSTDLPDVRMQFDNYIFTGKFAQAPYRAQGNWTSAVQTMPPNNYLGYMTLNYSDVTPTDYIESVEWLVQDTVVASYETDINSGTGRIIRQSDLTAGSFSLVDEPYKIRVHMAGSGWGTPRLMNLTSNYLPFMTNNLFVNNSIHDNGNGIIFSPGLGNRVFHNSFIGNSFQATDSGSNSWDNGYPSGGNYWSDYGGTDTLSGPAQNISGSDGIGDTPYSSIGGENGVQDNYPFMSPWNEPDPADGPVHNLDTGENFTTIQSAIDDPDTVNGHTIAVDPGLYYESIVVHKSLSILGAGARQTTVGHIAGTADGIQITADDSLVSGFTIENRRETLNQNGILVMASGTDIRGNIISNNSIGISVPRANRIGMVNSTADFETGSKTTSQANYEIETRTDNPAQPDGAISLGNMYGDSFNYPSFDALTWKWERAYPDNATPATTTSASIASGSLHLYAYTPVSGTRGKCEVNLKQQVSGNYDVRIRTTYMGLNQNEYAGFNMILDDFNFQYIHFGYDTSPYVQSGTNIGGVFLYNDFRSGTDNDFLFRMTRSGTYLTTYFKSDGTADITSDTGWTLLHQRAVGALTGTLWNTIYTQTSQFLPSTIDGYFDNYYMKQGTLVTSHRTAGYWTSPIYTADMPFVYMTLDYSNASSQSYIARIEWLIDYIPVAWYDPDIVSGSSVTIRETDLSGGSFADIQRDYRVRIYLIGNGHSSVTVNRVKLFTGISENAFSNNLIFENQIAWNTVGVNISSEAANTVFHNSFRSNGLQATDILGTCTWDNAYPSGGNYWSDYSGPDAMSGPAQNLPGFDGFGDMPYTAIGGGTGKIDRYPLMGEYVPDQIIYYIQLTVGWNLISVPMLPANTSPASVMQLMNGRYDVLKYYDSSDPSDPWKTYRPGASTNDLASIDNTIGLWVHATEATLLGVYGTPQATTSIDLHVGWNLVGYPANTGQTMAFALWGTGADRVETFDAADPELLRELGPTEIMEPGKGYWVHVSADTVWNINW